MAFTKGNKVAGSRKGIPNKVTDEVRELARSLFTKAYWLKKRQLLEAGELPPQIEAKLLAYAYGEPKQEHTLNTGITVNIGYLPVANSPHAVVIETQAVAESPHTPKLIATAHVAPDSSDETG